MHYYGTRLSENISRREPEGYLLCLNVPVARTGTQEYLPEELNLPPPALSFRAERSEVGKSPSWPHGLVPVFRPEEEVFSAATVASFEGMPVTNDHPPDGVDVSNIRALQKGHAHNVRRGSGEESDLLLADLIITDPQLIRQILEEGKREISCGYTYELCEENGRYIQRKIRGNHVAVVDAGRAGPRVSIRDTKPERSERRKKHMKRSLSKVLARMAKDGDVETVAEIIEEMLEPDSNSEFRNQNSELTTEPEKKAESEATVVTEEGTTVTVDEASPAEIIARLDRIIALLTPAAEDEEPAEEIGEAVEELIKAAEAEDPAAEEVSAVMEEILDPVASVITEPEEDEAEEEACEPLSSGDALRAALAAVRPALARMPRGMRQKVAGDIAARIRRAGGRGTTGTDAYAALASATRRTAPASAELGRRIMAKRNANYKGDR